MSTPIAQEVVDIRKRYQITDQHMLVLPAIVLLCKMFIENMKFSILSDGEAKLLDPVFKWMNEVGLVDLKYEGKMVYYVPSETGKKFFEQAHRRRIEFNQLFDIFCAVDITGSEPVFGFSKIFDYKKDDPAWKNFLAQECFEDLRVAVAEFKVNEDGSKFIDPVELVFMSFLKEGRFDSIRSGWEFDLMSGGFWKEVLQVCNSNLSWSEIGQEAMEIIINSGTELLYQLHEKEKALRAEDEAYAQQERELAESHQTTPAAPHSLVEVETFEVVEEEVYEESFPLGYFDPYYRDPYYFSSAWEPLVFFDVAPVVVIW